MITVIITGATGKMGLALSGRVQEDKSIQIGGAVERKGHPSVGSTFFHGIKIVDDLSLVLNKGDVVIDFTTPEATMEYIDICQKAKKPMVIGTTGLSSDQMAHLKQCAKFIPILYSANMSFGMNLLFKMIGEITKDLSGYDVEIIEAHHSHKVDAPSGTAKKLAEIIAEARALELEDVAVHGRKGKTGARRKEEIGIMSVRAGDIVGDHTIIFAQNSERIEIIHRVHRREAFAAGALKAAKFLVGKDPGLYSMMDIFR
ncbi:4-hydroxy-tetrahydrodipicolinate reductase [bacterium]|nr:4-hydroxy-tetrahydrodipicolinate reductase [bacterium]MBU1600158.1 4-hydroxy-tetrahydrodipicolinate reductase [bacterium]